jgi:hypothetical protein
MTSLQSSFKQTNGYFMVTLTTGVTIAGYTIKTAQTGSGGSSTSPVMQAASVGVLTLGSVLKDMGKTITTGAVGDASDTGAPVAGLGPRVFRKVQLLNQGNTAANGLINRANGVGSGFSTTDPSNNAQGTGYNTFYIELPTSGTPTASVTAFQGLSYIPGVPGFAF